MTVHQVNNLWQIQGVPGLQQNRNWSASIVQERSSKHSRWVAEMIASKRRVCSLCVEFAYCLISRHRQWSSRKFPIKSVRKIGDKSQRSFCVLPAPVLYITRAFGVYICARSTICELPGEIGSWRRHKRKRAALICRNANSQVLPVRDG